MSNAIVRDYFETKLKTFVAAQSPVVPVAWEDTPFDPAKVVGNFYLEPFLLPATTLDVTITGNRHRYLGIFQINVYCKSGKGTKTSEALCQGIIDYFPIVPKGSVSVEQTPYAREIKQELSGWKCTAVSINYRYEC